MPVLMMPHAPAKFCSVCRNIPARSTQPNTNSAVLALFHPLQLSFVWLLLVTGFGGSLPGSANQCGLAIQSLIKQVLEPTLFLCHFINISCA